MESWHLPNLSVQIAPDCISEGRSTMTEIFAVNPRLCLDQIQGDSVTKRTQNWAERANILNESWAESRAGLYKTMLKTFAVKVGMACMQCLKEPAVIRCNECFTVTYLCGSCDQHLHELLPFHDRDAVVNECYQPIPPTLSKNSCGEWITIGRQLPYAEISCPVCDSTCKRLANQHGQHCIVVSARGQFDLYHACYQCCNCNKELSTSNPFIISQLGFWPGSISDLYHACYQCCDIFHQDLFIHWDILQKQTPGISERSFFKSLELFSKEKGRLGTVNVTAFATCFREWKYCQFELDKERRINWMECPACSNNQHSVHVDDNMKLHRFTSAAVRKFSRRHVVIPAGMLQETPKRLEIAGCRHAIAQHAVNMMHGEVYGYAHYMQLNYFLPKNVQFFWYDVVRTGKPNHIEQEVLWGGRWQVGAGATTGEEVEQINSHFSCWGSSTKHMLPEAREELLTEHALQWNRRKAECLPQSLAKRYKKYSSSDVFQSGMQCEFFAAFPHHMQTWVSRVQETVLASKAEATIRTYLAGFKRWKL
ncbi:hypothetical protein P5673_015276 [Acropora cervicornis]|uniref:CxC3 like cysteine cluster domain-containing protein n=1 Tax=Acropora cervicornis TaxID=6130 RepID=A0AAD9QIN7_ACRCE|nr:hypothetical protein P5673_015276 [Acropora cervicornis]